MHNSSPAPFASAPAQRSPFPGQPNTLQEICLTQQEDDLFNLFVATTEHIRQTRPDLPPVILRVAGGWVRDKLIGKESEDVDIAIDTMKGEAFAQALKTYMESVGMATISIGTIHLNPDKSKHLETAVAKVNEHTVDFVHLRTETYNEDSRNPEVDFGTPMEDALRRDITINALFYNLHTRQVEDFLGKGIDDLRVGRIRTPLEPYQTFIDDPLRILRVIRFATRFAAAIDQEILEAAGQPDIQDAFLKKITRERVGTEVDKMLKGRDPVRFLSIIDEIGFYNVVFRPPQVEDVVVDSRIAFIRARVVESLLTYEGLHRIVPSIVYPLAAEDRRLLYLTAAVAPFEGLIWTEPSKPTPKNVPPREPKLHPVARLSVSQTLKLTNQDADSASGILTFAPEISRMVLEHSQSKEGLDRTRLGLLVREVAAKPLFAKWAIAVLFSLVREISFLFGHDEAISISGEWNLRLVLARVWGRADI
ncbi:hypothetical protein BDK51DRAFT_19998 [Blyttiomyces helicus]|uniref:Poly A polymerase head domain-containing protein n=1 Tax=Blyttiomyces helicus TaxID=388810 RepID=A0A4P9WDU8_9FUNG|nr:hypothetical protein BDK51DRAFT_19998 [Blyttiomyces helicus]|eukprot:RKO89408.1 hypothetical protein BDK51DRAFT_19998 [Blyttiomyces helicus]